MMKQFMICTLIFIGVNSVFATPNEKAEPLYLKGVEKNKVGLLIQASVLFTEAIAIDNQQHRYFHQRGMGFFGMGQANHGIKDYKNAVDLKSDSLNVYLKLINHYMNQSQYMLVLIITDQMVINLPEQAAGAYYDKGRAYESMKKPRLAIKAYQASFDELDSDQTDFKQLLLDKITAVKQQEMTQ